MIRARAGQARSIRIVMDKIAQMSYKAEKQYLCQFRDWFSAFISPSYDQEGPGEL